jgi:hypothetical protein
VVTNTQTIGEHFSCCQVITDLRPSKFQFINKIPPSPIIPQWNFCGESSHIYLISAENSHQHTNTSNQIAIGTQLVCQADQERNKELQYGTSVNNRFVELLFTLISHHKANMGLQTGDRCDRILWYGKGVKQLSYFPRFFLQAPFCLCLLGKWQVLAV